MLVIGNVHEPLAKSVLIPLGLTAAASATDAAIYQKMFGSDTRLSDLVKRTLIRSNKEMSIMKIVKSLKEPGLLIKGVSETIKNEVIKQNGGFLGMLLGTLSASLLGNLLTGKGTIAAGEGTIRAGQNLQCCLILTNFEIQKYYQNEHKFNGVFLRNNLPKIKDGAYVSLDQ